MRGGRKEREGRGCRDVGREEGERGRGCRDEGREKEAREGEGRRGEEKG